LDAKGHQIIRDMQEHPSFSSEDASNLHSASALDEMSNELGDLNMIKTRADLDMQPFESGTQA
jgi:hypothetical protein